MKNKKIILVLLILLLILAMACIVVVINIRQKNKVPPESLSEYGEGAQAREAEEFIEIDNQHEFYTIKSIINSFLSYVKQVNGDQEINSEKLKMTEPEARLALQKEGINAIKGVLDKQYTEDIQIDDNGIVNMLGKYKQYGDCKQTANYILHIKDVREKDLADGVTLVLVKTQVANKDLDILIKLDISNSTYSIFLEDYITKYNYNENMKKEDVKISGDEVEYTGYNKYNRIVATDEYICIDYFKDFKNNLLNNPEGAYNLLDEEYREKKYGNYEGFKNYIDENKERLENIEIRQYQSVKRDDETKYVCLDQDQRYYIFTQKNLVNYDVILDTYTIDLPEFLEKYENQSNQIKVGYNLQKIFNALHDEDYSYVYNKLDQTFRGNNFPNERDFENYARENFLDRTLKYSSFEEKNKICVANVKITDSDEKTITKQFIMRIDEGTDFIMSFEVN